MENIAHSRQPNKVSVTLSKKINNGNNGGCSGKTLYDDVYGGPPKSGVTNLSPRFEDYSEIFGSFHTARASSIPVLDLPAVDETDVIFDIRSDAFNYAEIFGGLDGLDFSVSYEDLVRQPRGRDGFSEEEAWTPVETDSFSGESDYSGNNQSVSNVDHLQSIDGRTEFNILYNKVNGMRNEDMPKRKAHITLLHAVPGFTDVFDDTTRLRMTGPSLQVVDDIDLDMEFNADKAKRNHMQKTMSHSCNFSSGERTFGSERNLIHNGCSRNGSHSGEMFITVSDISLRTLPSQVPPPSRPPPILDTKKGNTIRFNSNIEQVASEEAPGEPPFFDVEVDINSSAAAIEEAMHRAEVKLRSAEELERKKGGIESHVKSSFDVKNNETKTRENITRSNSLNNENMQATCEQRSSKAKISFTDERQKDKKAAPEKQDALEGERLLNLFEEKHVKESGSSQESDRSTGVGTWKEATEYFELVGTEESGNGKVIQPANHTKICVQYVRTHEHGRKEREASIHEEYKKKSEEAKRAYEQGKNIRRSKASNEDHRQREHVQKEKMVELFELQENEKKTRMAHHHGKTEKKVSKADQSRRLEDVSETQHKKYRQVENEKLKEVDRQTLSEVQWSIALKENEKKLKETEKRQIVKRCKLSEKMKENGKIHGETFSVGAVEGEEKMKDSVELEEIDERSIEAFKLDNPEDIAACRRENEMRLEQAKQIQSKKGLKEVHEGEDIGKSLEDSFKNKESDEGQKQAHGCEENEKGLEEDFELEMKEKRLKENDKRENEARERDQSKEKYREVCNGHGEGNRLQGTGDSNGIQKVQKQGLEQERNIGSEAQRKQEIESIPNQAFDQEGSADISKEDSHLEQSEKILEDAGWKEKDGGLDKALEPMEGNEHGSNKKFAKETGETWETESDENLVAAQSSTVHGENIGNLEVSQESIADQEIEKTRTGCKVSEKKVEGVQVENLLANGNNRAPEMTPVDAEHSETQSGKESDRVMNSDEIGFSSEQTCIEKTTTVPQMEFDPKSQERKLAHECDERVKINQHGKVALNLEEIRDQMSSTHANLCDDNRRNTEPAEPATVQEAVKIQKTSQQFLVAQSTKRKEKILNETPASVDKGGERMRRERELEKDHLRKIEEEREREKEREKDRIAVDKAMLEAGREREREKDRMAVDRATFEARDKAYAESCERAEKAAFARATVEARQRALAEARERLEKACAEARDRSYAEKATAEARLRAERAAVGRATAEARERAMEKLKDERATFESRERFGRSVSDKFGVSFRNDDMLDPHFQNISSAGSRYAYSSVYASSFSERSEGEGESAQRYRARLERYRRTAERAAKALEEKNMRDHLAQKEQAERNRLAETLDAEVRRWSSGKEGNLRALLSTLQYVLGPDSGWQPIPLTEVITSAAVKKAYRKATLCVHPDKLQQRGASIQHKYVCEKVFDLLKEAWNKFNSQER